MDYFDTIAKLGDLYNGYGIYPSECFGESSAVGRIRERFPEDPYLKDLDIFLIRQNRPRNKRGADLPWWDFDYFRPESKKKRIMIFSQDSLSEDAGSIVFYACLMDKLSPDEFTTFRSQAKIPVFSSWSRAQDMIMSIRRFGSIFLTDAMKVYKDGSWAIGDFDLVKSRQLIQDEIDFCKPDLIVILGQKSCSLILNENYSEVVARKILSRDGRNYLIGPFPSNQSNKDLFNKRREETLELISEFLM